MTVKHQSSLVLEGGGSRGVFTAGVLDYLMEKEVKFPYVVGVSAGSCNALDYVSWQPGRTRDCMIIEDKANSYIATKEALKKHELFDMDMLFDKYPNELFPFDFDTYFSNDMTCEIVTTNCLTGNAEYMTEESDRDRLMKICRASSSMPLVCPIVNVDGIPYLDGGLADSIPVKHVQEKGLKKIVLILTRPEGYRKKPTSKAVGKLYRKMYSKYPALVRTCIRRPVMYNRTEEYIEKLEKEGKIFVLRPEMKPVSRLEKDYDKLMAFYDHGYEMMKRELPRLAAYLEK